MQSIEENDLTRSSTSTTTNYTQTNFKSIDL